MYISHVNTVAKARLFTAEFSQLSIFTADCLRHPIQMAGVETIWELHTLIVMNSWYTPTHINEANPQGNVIEVNVYAAASLGLGHKGLTQFCAFLNLLPPVHHYLYQMHLKQISEASVAHAEENMKSAVSRVKSTLKDSGDVSDGDDENDDENDEACVDVGVSCDGSWHRRGFSSLVGSTAVISLETGQVLDYETSTKCAMNADTGKKSPILMQRRRHRLRSTHKFVHQLFGVCSWNGSSWCLSNVAAFRRKEQTTVYYFSW